MKKLVFIGTEIRKIGNRTVRLFRLYESCGGIFDPAANSEIRPGVVDESEDLKVITDSVLLIPDRVEISYKLPENLPDFVRIIADARRTQKTVEVKKGIKFGRLLEIWKDLLEDSSCSREQDVSIVLCQSSYFMLSNFMLAQRISAEGYMLPVRPNVKNIFVKTDEPEEIVSAVASLFSGVTGVKFITNPEEFASEARNTVVLFAGVDPDHKETFDLLCRLLTEGIFVIVDGNDNMNLDQMIAFKQALENGKGVVILSGHAYVNTFNPKLTIEYEMELLEKGCMLGMTEGRGSPLEAIKDMLIRGGKGLYFG